MKKILYLCSACLFAYMSSAQARVEFIAKDDGITFNGGRNVSICPEGQKRSGNKCVPDCKKSEYPFTTKPDETKGKVETCDNRYKYAYCYKGYTGNAKGECVLTDCAGFPLKADEIDETIGFTESCQSGSDTFYKYTKCYNKEAWNSENGRCVPHNCPTNLYPNNLKYAAPNDKIGHHKKCQSGEDTFWGYIDCTQPDWKSENGFCYNQCTGFNSPVDEIEGCVQTSYCVAKEGTKYKCTQCKDGYTKNSENGQCTVAPKARDKDNGNNSTLNCHIGDIYYSDDTCSPDVISGKTAIGIVYNTQYKLVMALEPEDTGKYYTGRWTTDYEYLPGKVGLDVDWDSFTDVADISNATSRIDAYKDMDGQHHTQVLAPEKGKVGIYGSEDAPHHCRNKTTADKEWYLPAAGEVVNWGLYYSEIDKGFKKLSKRLFPNNWTTVIWTSSEQNDAQAWGFEFSSLGRPRLEAFNKSDGHGVWCIFSYGQKDGNYVPPEVPCASGAFYYSDNTCGVELTKHKTLVGFVYDADQGLVISVEPKDLPWNDGSSEWSLVPNMTDTSHMTDTSNGEENTNKIVEFATSNGQEHKAAQYCHDMKVGGKTWFLPAKKEFSKYTSDYSTIYLSEIFLEGKGLARSCWLSNQGDKQYAFYVEDNWEDDASRPAKRTGFPLQQKNGMGYFHATPNLYPEAGYYSAGIKACCMTKFKTSNVQIPTQDKPTCSNEMKQAANAEGFIFTEEEKNNLLSKKPAGCNRECIKYGNSSCNLYSCYDYQVEFIPLASLTPTDCSNGGQYCGGANFKYDYQATADKLVAERGNGWRRPSYTEANKYSKIMMSSHPHDIIVPAEDGQRTLRGTTLMQGKVMDGGNIVSDTNDFPSAYMTYIVLMRDKDLTQNDKADICHLK